jgi:predicted nucleotidyltransferase
MNGAVARSAARGTLTPGSDVDLLYTLVPDARLGWAIEDLSAELSALLGRPVDLVSRARFSSKTGWRAECYSC